MSIHGQSLQRCRAFIDSNFVTTHEERPHRPVSITFSRPTYSRAHETAEHLIRLLELGRNSAKWALFDRDLVHRILEDHHLPKQIARYMPEDKDHDFTGVINEILGLHPSLWELFHYTCDTIRKLAKMGNVILIGRGAHIITRDLPHVIHVRIVSPMDRRMEHASKLLGLSREAARHRLAREDQASVAYLKSHFGESPENALSYDVVFNLGRIQPAQAARMILTRVKEQIS